MSTMENIIRGEPTDITASKKKKKVSYSQFSNYFNCAYRWKL